LFAPPAQIAYTLASPGRAQLAVYDASGRLLRTLLDADLPAGTHSSPWDGTDATGHALGSGAYFCRLTAGGNSVTGRLLLIR
jgi:flagellar hook assembly protein FlgD